MLRLVLSGFWGESLWRMLVSLDLRDSAFVMIWIWNLYQTSIREDCSEFDYQVEHMREQQSLR